MAFSKAIKTIVELEIDSRRCLRLRLRKQKSGDAAYSTPVVTLLSADFLSTAKGKDGRGSIGLAFARTLLRSTCGILDWIPTNWRWSSSLTCRGIAYVAAAQRSVPSIIAMLTYGSSSLLIFCVRLPPRCVYFQAPLLPCERPCLLFLVTV